MRPIVHLVGLKASSSFSISSFLLPSLSLNLLVSTHLASSQLTSSNPTILKRLAKKSSYWPHIDDEDMSNKIFSIVSGPSTLAGLGSLAKFPREIRDEIYGHLWEGYHEKTRNGEELSFSWFDSSERAYLTWDGPTRYPILHVSTCIRREATESLTSLKTFEIFALDEKIMHRGYTLDMSFLDRIMNVCVQYVDPLWNCNHPMKHALKFEEHPRILSLFAGTEVLRKNLDVRLTRCFVEDTSEIMDPPMIEAVRQLTGFKTVAFSASDLGKPHGRRSDAWENTDLYFQELKQTLEPALGPSTVHYDGWHSWGLTHFRKTVTFYPRDFLSKRIQSPRNDSEIQRDERRAVSSEPISMSLTHRRLLRSTMLEFFKVIDDEVTRWASISGGSVWDWSRTAF